MGQFDSVKGNVEANLAFREGEPNHPAISEKVGSLSNCQNRRTAKAPKDCGLAPGFVVAEEEDITALRFPQLVY